MTRAKGLMAALLLMAALAGLGMVQPASGREEDRAIPVRIGLVNSLFRDTPAPLVQAIMKPFKSLMESQTGLSGELVGGFEHEELGQQLTDDKVQLAVFHGFEFAWARQKYPDLKPMMIAVNQNRHLRAHLVVRSDSPATSIADLRGKTLAVPRRTREHCHLFLDRRCQSAGMSRKDVFARVLTPLNAEDALDGVATGIVDAVLTDGIAAEWYKEKKPNRATKVRSLEISEVFPASVIAYRTRALDELTVRRFREGMLTAKDNMRGQQLMALVQITSFEPIPEDYEQLLTDIAKLYPPSAREP